MGKKGRLQDKVAIITGAADGIGRAAALLFAEEGASLVICDINEEGLNKVRQEITKSGGKAVSVKCDVSVEEQVRSVISLAMDKFSKVDIVCNNAGITGLLSNLEDQDSDDWHRVLGINLMSVVYFTKHIVGHMKERMMGSIINIASVAGIRSGAGPNAYSASKAAVINFTQTSACELGDSNVRVNAICPGLIETGMTRPIFEYAREIGKIDKIGKLCELRRAASPGEVANAILFLASDEASYITGQAIAVDGGITASLSLPGKKI